MPYVIKKTDGNIVATVTDGTVDKSSTSITLIGKNYKGIGEIYNTNLVHLLESFANSAPPSNQIKGQLWFNTTTNKLNVYDGANWRPVGSPFVTASKPDNLVQGDLWIDNTNKQLKFYDGANLLTAGPIYTSSQGKTGWEVEEIVDSAGNTNIVASMYVRNIRMAILNAASFVPLIPIDGFTTGINPLKAGLTFSSGVTDNNINAPSESAQSLIDPIDGNLTTDQFVRSDKSSSISGSLTLAGDDSVLGLIVGPEANATLFVDTSAGVGNYTVCLANQVEDSKLILQVKDAEGFKDAIRIDPANKSVNVYPDDTWQVSGTTPSFNINGDTTIQGGLTVVGPTQFTNSTTVQISDKNIELAVTENPTNTTANGAGLTVQGGLNNDKTFRWLSTGILVSNNPPVNYSTWEVNDNFKIPNTNAYYIGNNYVINHDSLGPNVTGSVLTSVGSLVNLTAAKFNFTDNVLTVTDQTKNLEINVAQARTILLTNRVRIVNVDDPSQQFDATNKQYVDSVKTSINYLTIDITGIASPDTGAVPQITALIPPAGVNVGDLVRVLCLDYSSFPTVTRTLKVFECDDTGGPRVWKHQTGNDINIL